MSFSRGQQPEFRTLAAVAWIAHCLKQGLPKTTKQDRDWYERELCVATGKASSTECNADRDYNLAMAHFEALAGTGIKWQMKLYKADVERMLWSLTRDFGAEALRRARVDEEYLLRCIRNGFGKRQPWEVDREDLITIVGEVKRYIRRDLAHARHTADEKAEAWADMQAGMKKEAAEKVATEEDRPF